MLENSTSKIYASVLSDGKIHVGANEGDMGAVSREYEKKDGTKAVKWETIADSITGTITKVDYYDGIGGKNLLLTIESKGSSPVVLSLGTKSDFGKDVLKKILAVDLKKEVTLKPYNFTPAGEIKVRKGVSVSQDGVKIDSYFYDKVAKETINGAPKPRKANKDMSKGDWTLFFMEENLFLIDEIARKFNIGGAKETSRATDGFDDEIDSEDIPF